MSLHVVLVGLHQCACCADAHRLLLLLPSVTLVSAVCTLNDFSRDVCEMYLMLPALSA